MRINSAGVGSLSPADLLNTQDLLPRISPAHPPLSPFAKQGETSRFRRATKFFSIAGIQRKANNGWHSYSKKWFDPITDRSDEAMKEILAMFIIPALLVGAESCAVNRHHDITWSSVEVGNSKDNFAWQDKEPIDLIDFLKAE